MGLEELVRTLDGTRYYSPSSNQVNLQNSGPYSYQNPALYYSTLNRGFSVETGTPSMSTLESFKSSFERKAQMLNYVDHRAIFEGMNANLWAPNSGRLLWMTQPAWPSTMWQILSSDYDTQASFYGTQKACEPVHVQLNLATDQVDIINTTTRAWQGLTASAKVYSLANTLLYQAKDQRDLAPDSEAKSMKLDLKPYLSHGMALVKLELKDAQGKLVSQNLYWLGADSASYRELTHLAPTLLKASASSARVGDMVSVKVQPTRPRLLVSPIN